jgi:signal transduction histidine kinase
MKETKRLLYPVFIFVFSIVALGLSLFLYIYWYVEVSSRLQTVIKRFDLDRGQFFQLETWVVIVILSILVGLILVGVFVIFAYHVKTNQLYRLQRNFINNFTHELKTPVTSIKLYLETFQKFELTRDNQLKYIDYMLSDVARLTDNINRILNLSRIESGGYKGEFVSLDLVEVVDKFIDKNKHLFGNCQIIIKNTGDSPMNQPVDLALFEILLMNLLTNAIKYNDSERPEISICFTKQQKAVQISFTDNGRGVDRNEFKNIFKKFYQIKKSGMTTEGSGIGLYLIEKIAKIHNWKIVVNSAGAGKGATFTLTLPSSGRSVSK